MGENEAQKPGISDQVEVSSGRKDRPADRRITVEISKDGLSASITVFPPEDNAQPAALEEAREKLAQAGVVFGVDERALEKAVMERSGKPEPVAVGLPVTHGLDGQIEFQFKTDIADIKPSELADGRADFYNLNLVQNVEMGQLLAVRTSPQRGAPGKTVTGEELRPRPGKEARLFAGKNARWSDDGIRLLATAQGHAVVANNKVEVQTVFEQAGDVDFSSGNLDCLGSIVIRGAVKAGFTVRAADDVEIMETVDGGTVIAGGNVQVRKGILGHGDSKVTAGGSLKARFIENGRVEAGKDVVADAIMHSQIVAGGNVIMEGKKGLIVGGLVRAGQDVIAKTIGSYLTTPTYVEAGVRPELRIMYTETVAAIAERKANVDKVDKAVKLLVKLEKTIGQLPAEKGLMLDRLKETLTHLGRELVSLEERLAETEAEITAGKGRVGASGTIYPGVTVTIGRNNLPIRDERRFVVLGLDQGDIRTYPFR